MDNRELFQIIRKALWGTGTACADNDLFEELTAQAIECLAAPVLSCIQMPEDLRMKWKKQILRQIFYYNTYLSIQKTLPISLPYVILKGTAAGQYYPYPEYRRMGDIDIMTRCEDYQRACHQLLDNGYIEVTSKNDLERNRHREFIKNGFSVEVHIFFASMNDPVKAEIFDRLITDHINDSHILPHSINGLVLLEHINQHLEEGLGLRQIIDWMMFVNKELPDEKWPEFKEMTEKTGLKKLAITVTRMCELEFGLKEHTWCRDADESLCRKLLSYILACGNFGQKISYEEELASGRAGKLRHPVRMIRELQQMGLKNWKWAKQPVLKHFAWVWQGYIIARSTSGLVAQYGVNKRLNRMFDQLEVRRKENGLVYYENGKYIRKKPSEESRSDKPKETNGNTQENVKLQDTGKVMLKCIARQFGFGGGAPLSLLQHYLILQKNGYDTIICIAHGSNDYLQEKYEKAFGTVIDRKSSAEHWNESEIIKSFLEYKWEYQLIRRERPDLVVALGEFNAALYSYICRKMGIPLIVYIAGGTLNNQGRVIKMWRDCEVICFSKENEDEIIKHFPQDHVHVISNRVSIAERFSDMKTHYQTEQQEIHVLITSRLADDKIQSIYSLIRQLSQCASEETLISVRIAGGGPMKEELLDFCSKMSSAVLTIKYLGHIDELTEQFRWAHIAAGKGRSVIEPIMMNRIGCIIGEDGKIDFCNDKNFENIYHYNFSGRNLETQDSLKKIREMIEKIKKGAVADEDVITPSELVSIHYSAEYLPDKLKKVLDMLPAPKHRNAKAFLPKQFFCLIINKFRERMKNE